MTDIIERLRFGIALDELGGISWCNNEVMFKAADEIERLREELQSIADVSERWTDSLVSQINEMAHKALKEKE